MQRVSEDSVALAESLLANVADCWKSQAIGTFAELDIAKHMRVGFVSSTRLAELLDCPREPLHRFLNACVTLDLVCKSAEDQFELTPTGMLLAEDAPNSVRNWVLWWTKELWPAIGELSYSVRTGTSARQKLYGTSGFEHLDQNPERAAMFHRGLGEITRFVARDIVRSFDFSKFDVVLDVGGGSGQLLAAILDSNKDATGILFDLPSAIDQLRPNLGEPELKDRVKFVAGDFFHSIPKGADAVVLKSVLHDWSREDALRILNTCRQSIEPGQKLLLIERFAPSEFGNDETSRTMAQRDLTMLVAHGSKERTEDEYRDLLVESGFSVETVTPTMSGFSILEAS